MIRAPKIFAMVANLKTKTYNVAVVGATGAVGQEMIRMLDERKFPVKTLRLFASDRSKGKSVRFKGRAVKIETIDSESLSGIDVAVFSAGAAVSKQIAPIFAKKGIFVIDNSSAWRMDPEVPLVVPEINPHAVSSDTKIIANPNCSTIQMVLALKPIHDAAKVCVVRVATYQSVSGAGGRGIQELEEQSRAWAEKKPIPPSKKIPYQIAFNLVPQIDVFEDEDYTKEEWKMVNETRKILEAPEIKVSATCVRVPVFRCHSEAVWVETARPISPQRVRELLRKMAGVVVSDDPRKSEYPMPLTAAGRGETFVGRIRRDLTVENGISMWVVSDNLLKGAALNAIQIAELLVDRKLI